jgi:hypothetical protein
MTKRKSSPDRRGMGAQSDFISEQFVPGERHRDEQLVRAQTLLAMGLAPEQVAAMLSIPLNLIVGEPASN